MNVPIETAPSVSRNKTKLSNEFVTASDKKDHRCEFTVTIKRKMINGKEVVAGCINKWDYTAGGSPMVEETTSKTAFANQVKEKVLEAFDQL
jgi:hypothetical protein